MAECAMAMIDGVPANKVGDVPRIGCTEVSSYPNTFGI